MLYYSYLGVKYILTSKDITLNFPLVYDIDVKIYKNPHAFPRVYIARNTKMASGFQEAQNLMKAEDIDIKNTVIIEEQPPHWYKPSSATLSSSQPQIEEYNPNRVKIKANFHLTAY